jgi:hypothetical protein
MDAGYFYCPYIPLLNPPKMDTKHHPNNNHYTPYDTMAEETLAGLEKARNFWSMKDMPTIEETEAKLESLGISRDFLKPYLGWSDNFEQELAEMREDFPPEEEDHDSFFDNLTGVEEALAVFRGINGTSASDFKKQPELTEVTYQVTRSPVRRVFSIDVGGMPPVKAMAYLENIKAEIRNRTAPSGIAIGSLKVNPETYEMMVFVGDEVGGWVPLKPTEEPAHSFTKPVSQMVKTVYNPVNAKDTPRSLPSGLFGHGDSKITL